MPEHAPHVHQRQVEAGEAFELGERKIDDELGTCGSPATVTSDGVPPQRSSTIAWRARAPA